MFTNTQSIELSFTIPFNSYRQTILHILKVERNELNNHLKRNLIKLFSHILSSTIQQQIPKDCIYSGYFHLCKYYNFSLLIKIFVNSK